jgi:acetyltransferase-like isoleucine patch superfamily enzyme
MTSNEKQRRHLLRIAAAIVFCLYKGILYFLSFLGPVLVIYHFRELPIAVLLAMAIIGYGVAAVLFISFLVLTKKFIIGPIEVTGRVTLDEPGVKRWFVSTLLTSVLDLGLFSSITVGVSLFAPWYYRGMGARMPNSVFIGGRALIFEPWFLEVGENVSIGGSCLILGHRGEGPEIVLGRVIIEDGAVIGARSVIFPNVRIGSHAVVAACALVTSGTVIPPGETWGGIPARKLTKS